MASQEKNLILSVFIHRVNSIALAEILMNCFVITVLIPIWAIV